MIILVLGIDNDLDLTPNYLFIKNSPFPLLRSLGEPDYPIPCAKILGQARQRPKAFGFPPSSMYPP